MDTKSCVAHDMGTCFLHNGYHSIVDLVNEYNLTTTVAPEGRAMFSHFAKDSFSSQSMQEFVTSSIMDGLKQMNYGALVCLQNRTEVDWCFDKGCKAVQESCNSQFRLDCECLTKDQHEIHIVLGEQQSARTQWLPDVCCTGLWLRTHCDEVHPKGFKLVVSSI